MFTVLKTITYDDNELDAIFVNRSASLEGFFFLPIKIIYFFITGIFFLFFHWSDLTVGSVVIKLISP